MFPPCRTEHRDDKYKEVERVLDAAFVRYVDGDLDFEDLLYRVLIINQVRIAEDPKFPYPEERDHYGTTSVIAGWLLRGVLSGGAEGITVSQYGLLSRAHWGDVDDPWW